MEHRIASTNIRTGRFLWMDEPSKKRYLTALVEKIEKGYFSSDQILLKVVDELAPVFSEHLDADVSMSC